MRYGKKFILIASAILFLSVGLVYEANAQSRVRVIRRPVIVRTYVYRDPFWRTHYSDPFYRSYLRDRERQYYLERDLEGNRRELAKHLRKYHADGVITAKERRELADDYKDVRESIEDLRRYGRYYRYNY